jgi:hypothetical protein
MTAETKWKIAFFVLGLIFVLSQFKPYSLIVTQHEGNIHIYKINCYTGLCREYQRGDRYGYWDDMVEWSSEQKVSDKKDTPIIDEPQKKPLKKDDFVERMIEKYEKK